MQIHEITRSTLNEVDLTGPSGVLSGIKNAATALAQPGGVKAALSAIVPGTKQGFGSTKQLAQSDFAKMMADIKNQSTFRQVTKNLQTSWEQRRADISASSPGGSAQQNIVNGVDEWFTNVVIPQSLRSEKAQYLNAGAGPAPAQIIDSLKNIKSAERLPTAQRQKVQAEEIAALAGATSALSQLLTQQNPKLAQTSKTTPRASTVKTAQTNIAKVASLNPGQLAQIQQVMNSLPPVNSRDPTTVNYLRALGFDVT